MFHLRPAAITKTYKLGIMTFNNKLIRANLKTFIVLADGVSPDESLSMSAK